MFVGWRLLFQDLVRLDSRPGSDSWGGGWGGGGGEEREKKRTKKKRERESFCLVRAAVAGFLRAHFEM